MTKQFSSNDSSVPMTIWQRIDAHLNNVAFYQTVFSLPFAYMAAFLAAKGKPDMMVMVWITLTIIAARSAALALDNLIDLKYDVDQPRFASRPMVAGQIHKGEIYLLVAVCFGVLFFSVLQLNPICIKLLPVAALPFVVYPFMKRITCFCHYVCGIAVAMAPAGGWVAVTGSIDYPMVILCLAVALWIGGFDVVYGAQDEEFDKAHGLHSMATVLGAKGALLLAKITHVACLMLFAYLGWLLELGIVYTLGVAVSAGVLYYQHSIIHSQGFGAFTRQYYMRNGIVSIAIFLFTLISIYAA